jgi:hypothetical protein
LGSCSGLSYSTFSWDWLNPVFVRNFVRSISLCTSARYILYKLKNPVSNLPWLTIASLTRSTSLTDLKFRHLSAFLELS